MKLYLPVEAVEVVAIGVRVVVVERRVPTDDSETPTKTNIYQMQFVSWKYSLLRSAAAYQLMHNTNINSYITSIY